jgi:hypothetical protein
MSMLVKQLDEAGIERVLVAARSDADGPAAAPRRHG